MDEMKLYEVLDYQIDEITVCDENRLREWANELNEEVEDFNAFELDLLDVMDVLAISEFIATNE